MRGWPVNSREWPGYAATREVLGLIGTAAGGTGEVPGLTQGPAKGKAPERTSGPQSEGPGKQPLGEPNGRRPLSTQGPAKGKAPERYGPQSQLERPSCDDSS